MIDTDPTYRDRIARYWRHIASTPKGVLPADPAALLNHATAILPSVFDFCRQVSTPGGAAHVLRRRDGPSILFFPNGRWRTREGEARGGGIVSLLMMALDLDAADALVAANVAMRLGAPFAPPSIRAECSP